MNPSTALWYAVQSRILRDGKNGKWLAETVIHVGGHAGLLLAKQFVAGRQEDTARRNPGYTREFRILAMTEVETT